MRDERTRARLHTQQAIQGSTGSPIRSAAQQANLDFFGVMGDSSMLLNWSSLVLSMPVPPPAPARACCTASQPWSCSCITGQQSAMQAASEAFSRSPSYLWLRALPPLSLQVWRWHSHDVLQTSASAAAVLKLSLSRQLAPVYTFQACHVHTQPGRMAGPQAAAHSRLPRS